MSGKHLLIVLISSMVIAFAQPAIAKLFGENLCDDSHYTCIKILPGESWSSLFPDLTIRNLIRRINRMNVRLRPGMIVALPLVIENVDHMDFAPFARQESAFGAKTLVFDPSKLAWGAYDVSGTLINWGPASGGKSWCADVKRSCLTRTGSFSIQSKGGPGCKSSKYPMEKGGGAPMPYCMFFSGGYGFHGSYEVPGYNASHGCVRLFVDDAKWLSLNFVESGKTRVVVRSYAQQ